MRTPVRLRQGGRGWGKRSLLIFGSCLSPENSPPRLIHHERGKRQYTCRERNRLLGEIFQILDQGTERMLRVVDPQISILLGGVERAQQNRTIPIGKMLCVCLRVLKR